MKLSAKVKSMPTSSRPGAARLRQTHQQARADAALVRYFEFYAGACDKLHGDTIPYLDGYSVLDLARGLCVVGSIIPWNYPMQIFGRSVGGALAASNVCVVNRPTPCLSLIRVAQLAAKWAFRRHHQHRHRLWPRVQVTRWPGTRASTTSASPAAPRGHADPAGGGRAATAR